MVVVTSAPWARIISDGYNRGLAPKNNRNLAVILASCPQKQMGNEIWTAELSKNIGKEYDDMKLIGGALYQYSRPNLQDITADAGHHTVIKIAKNMKIFGKTGDIPDTNIPRPEEDDDDLNESDYE